MTDLQRIVDDLRFALQAQVCELTDGLRAAALAYAAACRETNERLRRCDDLLRRNLRSEAIHLAEADPNVLDVVATLDFPERTEWNDVGAMYDLPEAEPLLLDIAQDLNQAYTANQPLEKLLNRHRKLAIVRAPLNQRLDVMRNLAELDDDSSFWDDDIRSFERARFDEIDFAAKDAARRRDEGALAALAEELRAGEWRETVPPSLGATVKRLKAGVSRATGAEQAVRLTEELQAAFQELDLERARQLRMQWLEAVSNAKLPANDPLRDQAEPILGWIADEDARQEADRGFTAALATLDRTLETDASLEELQTLHHAVMRFDRPLPEVTAVRYQNRTSALAIMDQRTRRIRIGAMTAAAIAVAVLTGFLVVQQQRNTTLQATLDAVGPLIESGSFDRAREMLHSHPEIAGRQELIAAETKLNDEERKDRERQTRFAADLVKVKAAADYEHAMVGLKDLRSLARFEADRVALEDVERDWELKHEADLAAKEKALQRRIDEATRLFAELQAAAMADVESDQTGELMTRLGGIVKQLKADSNAVRKEIGTQVDLLAARHHSHEKSRAAALRRRQLLTGLTARSLILPDAIDHDADVEAFSKALHDYASALEGDARSARLEECLAEREHWSSALRWQRMVKSWPILWPAVMNDVTTRIDACEQFLKANGNGPEAADAREYLAALQSVRAREIGGSDAASGGLRAKLRRNFSHDLIAEGWIMQTGDGRTYYVSDTEDISSYKPEHPVAPRHRIGFLPEDLKGARGLNAGDFVTNKPVQAPQNAIAKIVRDKTAVLGLDEWESFFLQLADKIVEEPTLDPFLKYDLLKRVLETGSGGSPFFKRAVAPQLEHLQRASIDPLAHWMDPTNADANKARQAARDTLKAMPAFGDVSDRVENTRKSFEASLRQPTFMVGWLERAGNQWQCRTVWKPDGDYDLVVAYGEKPADRSEWRRIGEANAAGIKLVLTEGAFLHDGRPIFAAAKRSGSLEVTSR